MSVVVTGAGGFLGGAVASSLPPEDTVALRRWARTSARLRTLQADLAIAADVDRLIKSLRETPVRALVHCAASTPYNAGADDLRMNEDIDDGVARLCRSLKIPRVVFASGWVVYDVDEVPVPEAAPTTPPSAYGLSKLGSERTLAARLGAGTLVTLRLASVYGPEQRTPGLIPSLVAMAAAGGPLRVDKGATRRDYIHVADVVHAFSAAWALPLDANLVVNIGSGRSLSAIDVATTLRDAWLAERGERLEIVVDDPGGVSDPPDNRLDVELAMSMGLVTHPIALADGLRDVIRGVA